MSQSVGEQEGGREAGTVIYSQIPAEILPARLFFIDCCRVRKLLGHKIVGKLELIVQYQVLNVKLENHSTQVKYRTERKSWAPSYC